METVGSWEPGRERFCRLAESQKDGDGIEGKAGGVTLGLLQEAKSLIGRVELGGPSVL